MNNNITYFFLGLSHFNKSEVLAKVASESAAEKTDKVEVKYVKDDFFDMLSNDASGGKGSIRDYKQYIL